MNRKMARAIIVENLRQLNIDPAFVPITRMNKAIEILISRYPNNIQHSLTYDLKLILPGETWQYYNVNVKSLVTIAYRIGDFHCKKLSPKSVEITRLKKSHPI
jgi:hypothetical protein